MTTIIEGALSFEFPEGWRILKYDESTFFVNHFQNVCEGAKGVDIVAIAPKDCLWLIEVKDYRAGARQKLIDLAMEIAIKVRDSLAGLAAARLRANVGEELELADQALRCKEMKVVLHMEQHQNPTRLYPVEDVSKLILKLKQLLRAIDYHPRVTSLTEDRRFGWIARTNRKPQKA